MEQLYGTILLSVVVISVLLYLKLIQVAGGRKRPPGPRGLPILGYLPFLSDNLLDDLKGLEQRYGPIYKLRLGHTHYTVISSPSLAKEVLRDHDAIFAHRVTPVAVSVATFGGSDIAWSPPNSEWRAMRKIFVQEMMSSTNLEESYRLRREEVRQSIKHLYTEMIGKPVDVGEMSYTTELNVLMNLSWGATVTGELGEMVAAEVRAVVAKIMDLVGKPNVSDYYPFLARLDVQGIKKKMESYMESLNKILDVVIGQHDIKLSGDHIETFNKDRKDFLQILLELIRKEGDAETLKISQKQLRAMLMDVVGGGSDTSATIEWAMAELMNNPKVMAKARKQVSDVVGLNDIVEEFHIPKLKYLEAVIKETLRLHPPVPLLIPRSPARTSTIGGFTIPKGSGIYINIWSIQRDPSIWENPLEFKPERFLDPYSSSSSSSSSTHDFGMNQHQYLPFGSGRRVCAGRALAERMILHFLASLLHSFDWSLPNGGKLLDMSETYGLVLRKSAPLIIVPTPRLPDFSCYM